jgi:hypothetical protein
LTAVGGRNPTTLEKAVARASAVRICFDLDSEPVDVTAAHSGVDKHRAGARLFSHRRLWGLNIDVGSGGLSPVVMMQPADQWQFDHLSNVTMPEPAGRVRAWDSVRRRSSSRTRRQSATSLINLGPNPAESTVQCRDGFSGPTGAETTLFAKQTNLLPNHYAYLNDGYAGIGGEF